jgi:hypothetical protein
VDSTLQRELDQLIRVMSVAENLSADIDAASDLAGLAYRVDRLQQGVPALIGLLAGADAPDAAPAPVAPREASDASGAVRVVLADDGLPESITVDGGWRSLVGSEGFAAAVTEACRSAMTTPAQDEPTLPADRRVDDARRDRADDIVAFIEGSAEPPAGLGTIGTEPVRPRPFADIVDEVMRAADAATSLLSEENPDGSAQGTAALGRLSLTINPFGVVTCSADPAWVGSQETVALADALAVALRSARNRRAASLLASPEAMVRAIPDFSRVFIELQALLRRQEG